MFRMRERLKLPRAAGVPFGKGIFRDGLLENTREKPRLRAKIHGLQSAGLARILNGREIDVRGQILFARIGQQIVGDMVAMIRAKRAAKAGRRKHFVTSEAVVKRQQFAARQNSGGGAPPSFGGRTGFDDVAIRQHGFQLRIADCEWRIRNLRPTKSIASNGDAPFKPFFFFRIPAVAMDGKSVQQFVAENDAVKLLNR